MSEPKSATPDPSMDDILASIRKIISDDEARAQAAPPAGSSRPAPAPAVTPLHAVPPSSIPGGPQPDILPPGSDDVLLLTDLIEEPRSEKVPPPLPLPRIDPVRASEMPQPAVEPGPETGLTGHRLSGNRLAAEGLVDTAAAASAAQAFARLSQVVQESGLAPGAVEAPPASAGGGLTVEELVREALRPLLKDWLDRNLPPLVERIVEREVARLTRR